MILAYRKKTGCKQYVFASKIEAFDYFHKRCYQLEQITLYEYDDVTNREISKLSYTNYYRKPE